MTVGPPLRVYAPRHALPAGLPHIALLFPFWGAPAAHPASPTGGRYDHWTATGSNYIALADYVDAADVAVLPFAWEHAARSPLSLDYARALIDEAGRAKKAVIVFYVADDAGPVPLDAQILRPSLYRSNRRSNEHAMPALAADVLAGLTFTARPLDAVPTVGFCGLAPGFATSRRGSLEQRARHRVRIALGRAPQDTWVRAAALRALRRSDRVRTAIVARSEFWAGSLGPDNRPDYARMRDARREFVSNMVGSDYVLCARGGGNFSYRIYETLSAGRIPVFVDTDCVLPFEKEIDWRRLCVWIDKSEISSAGAHVHAFHSRFTTSAAFEEHQRECRAVWESWLSPAGFYSNLWRYLPLPPPLG